MQYGVEIPARTNKRDLTCLGEVQKGGDAVVSRYEEAGAEWNASAKIGGGVDGVWVGIGLGESEGRSTIDSIQ